MAGGRGPVGGAAKHADGREWPDFFGPDIMRETTAVLAHATGEDAHHRLCAVGQRPAVIPVQNTGTGNEQAFALGLAGGVTPFTRDPQHQFTGNPGFLFLPGRREGFVGVIVVFRIIAAKTAVDAKLGEH